MPQSCCWLLVLLSSAEALQSVTLGRTVPPALVRTHVPLAQFGRKPPQQQPADDGQEEAMTPERRSFEAGEGNLFFQAPTPLTGEQNDLDPFLSKEDLALKGDISTVQLVITGLFGVLFLWLAGTLIFS